jgi:hypothetical protein
MNTYMRTYKEPGTACYRLNAKKHPQELKLVKCLVKGVYFVCKKGFSFFYSLLFVIRKSNSKRFKNLLSRIKRQRTRERTISSMQNKNRWKCEERLPHRSEEQWASCRKPSVGVAERPIREA